MFAANSRGMLSPIQSWLDDDAVSEIMINRPQEVWVEKNGSVIKHHVPAFNHYHLSNLLQLLATENHQSLNQNCPILSGSLMDGSRIQCVIEPISLFPVIAIRRQIERKPRFDEFFIESQSLGRSTSSKLYDSYEERLRDNISHKAWRSAVYYALYLKKTIVISGGTSSGKTSLLNACLDVVNTHDRMITLEDTREIVAPHLNQVNLLISSMVDDRHSITMQDLIKCSLRLRPDRIVIGEIRGAEIVDFLNAAATGHEGCMTTIHAGSPQEALIRMKQLYKLNAVPSMTDQEIIDEIRHVIDVIIQVKKTNNGREVVEVVELTS